MGKKMYVFISNNIKALSWIFRDSDLKIMHDICFTYSSVHVKSHLAEEMTSERQVSKAQLFYRCHYFLLNYWVGQLQIGEGLNMSLT